MKKVPIFPLPNVVFFPRVILPLHIFEPRYRQMTEDALAGEKLLAVVLLKPGFEDDYYGNPPVHETATIGRIEHHETLEEGHYNIALAGLERVRLVEGPRDEDAEKLYRTSWTVADPEAGPPPGSPTESELQLRLQSLWSQLLVEIGAEVAEESRIESEVSFEGLVNRIATSVALQAEEKQALLELSNLVERAKTLDSVLQEQILYWSAIRRFRNLSPNDPRVN
jgi:hypothetical protein